MAKAVREVQLSVAKGCAVFVCGVSGAVDGDLVALETLAADSEISKLITRKVEK